LNVIGRPTIKTVHVRADGTGLSSRAGTSLLALVAQRLGLTDGLSAALCGTRKRRSDHDPGRILGDLAVMAADGGRGVSDLAALAGQNALFGDVASVSTARRVLLSIGESELEPIRQARALARERAWRAGATPERLSWTSTALRSRHTPRRIARRAITKAASASTRCSSAVAARSWLGSSGRETLPPATLPITGWRSNWHSSSCREAHAPDHPRARRLR
jgi:hypothetical protein